MDKYNKDFDMIFKFSKKEANIKIIPTQKNKYDCANCDSKIKNIIDTQSANIVCTQCGFVSASNVILHSSYIDRSNHSRVFRKYNYSRLIQFNKYLNKKNFINYKLSQQLNNMFYRIMPFFKMENFNRINSIRYEYIIFKFLELLDRKDLCIFYSLPKSKLIIYKYDLIWKQLCKEVNWPFINSVCIMCVIEKRKYNFENKHYVTIY